MKNSTSPHSRDSPLQSDTECDWESVLSCDTSVHHPLNPYYNSFSIDNTIQNINEPLVLTLANPLNSSSLSKSNNFGNQPSKSQAVRYQRCLTHIIHVQTLLFHSWYRNNHLQDPLLRAILLSWTGINPHIINLTSSFNSIDSCIMYNEQKTNVVTCQDRIRKSARLNKYRASETLNNQSVQHPCKNLSFKQRLEQLAQFWHDHFTITQPGLRKRGYFSTSARCEQNINKYRNWLLTSSGVRGFNPLSSSKIKSPYFKSSDNSQPVMSFHGTIPRSWLCEYNVEFGEQIKGLPGLIARAMQLNGSRDTAAQLFVGLLRSLGLRARLICNLQVLGFSWSRVEQRKDSMINQSEDKRTIDDDLSVPIYWCEVYDPGEKVLWSIRTHPDVYVDKANFERSFVDKFSAKISVANLNQMITAYIIGWEDDGSGYDLTAKYQVDCKLPGRTRGFRWSGEPEKCGLRGKSKDQNGELAWNLSCKWINRLIETLETLTSKLNKGEKRLPEIEEILPIKFEIDGGSKEEEGNELTDRFNGGEKTLEDFKKSKKFVLFKQLKRDEAIRPGVKPVRYFTRNRSDKANMTKSPTDEQENQGNAVYLRSDVVICKSVESWHKEGRRIKDGEIAVKMVIPRVVTTKRKRLLEEARLDTGSIPRQGLYYIDQTEWIIPEPIKDGKIPRNEYGNIDIYVKSMIPQGAKHITWGNGMIKVCKRLGIDFAEACIGFEFSGQAAIPILHGIVIPEEYESVIYSEWLKDREAFENRQKVKREVHLLSLWKKFYKAGVIRLRLRTEYD